MLIENFLIVPSSCSSLSDEQESSTLDNGEKILVGRVHGVDEPGPAERPRNK